MSKTSTKIARLNDTFRRTLAGGKVVLTSGVTSMSEEQVREVLHAVRTFEDFAADDDLYGEHDFGALAMNGEKLFWKIDYYNKDMSGGSEDPADPVLTTRVLTVMLAEEY